MTLREYITIINDIDGYIARGGELLDLKMFDPSSLGAMGPAIQGFAATLIDPSAADRFWRFANALSELGAPNDLIGDLITEERARAIWSETLPR